MRTIDTLARGAGVADEARIRVGGTRLALLAGMVLAALGGAAWARTPAGIAAAAAYEADLAALLMLMAAIKTGIVAVVTAVLWWRLAQPIAAARAGAYLVCAWVMSAATVAVWTLSAVGAAAVVFHTGELALFVLAIADRGPLLTALRRGSPGLRTPADPHA